MSAYALFFRDSQASIKAANPNAAFGDVSKIVASMWDGLDPDSKAAYKKRTENAKKDYLKKLAAYRASLVSKGNGDAASIYGAYGYAGYAAEALQNGSPAAATAAALMVGKPGGYMHGAAAAGYGGGGQPVPPRPPMQQHVAAAAHHGMQAQYMMHHSQVRRIILLHSAMRMRYVGVGTVDTRTCVSVCVRVCVSLAQETKSASVTAPLDVVKIRRRDPHSPQTCMRRE